MCGVTLKPGLHTVVTISSIGHGGTGTLFQSGATSTIYEFYGFIMQMLISYHGAFSAIGDSAAQICKGRTKRSVVNLLADRAGDGVAVYCNATWRESECRSKERSDVASKRTRVAFLEWFHVIIPCFLFVI